MSYQMSHGHATVKKLKKLKMPKRTPREKTRTGCFCGHPLNIDRTRKNKLDAQKQSSVKKPSPQVQSRPKLYLCKLSPDRADTLQFSAPQVSLALAPSLGSDPKTLIGTLKSRVTFWDQKTKKTWTPNLLKTKRSFQVDSLGATEKKFQLGKEIPGRVPCPQDLEQLRKLAQGTCPSN